MVSDRGELYIESKEGILLNLLFLLVGREGIEDGDYLTESKDISETPE